ncbi:MAG: polyphosphate kinase 2 family protein [Tannerellaceae bacterium]|nr:polyphosphate kinase 2 family protein [Tannerellaceae bacterium]
MKKEFFKKIIATPGQKHLVSEFDPAWTGKMIREEADMLRNENVEKLAELQDKLYAQDRYAILAVFQGMDGAGKDGTIKHVMSGINPHGCQVFSFKQPSSEDLDHDYLWRINKCLPERGRIGIFNRSHYEDVLVTKVHPEILLKSKLPDIQKVEDVTEKFWKKRYRQINDFEQYLTENGIIVVKFFLNVSREEQRKRFISRLKEDSKHWKFSSSDFEESMHWDSYMKVYSDVLTYTSTTYAPWHVIPANNKWFMRYLVGQIICDKVAALKPDYPKVTPQESEEIEKYKTLLLQEGRKNKIPVNSN